MYTFALYCQRFSLSIQGIHATEFMGVFFKCFTVSQYLNSADAERYMEEWGIPCSLVTILVKSINLQKFINIYKQQTFSS